MKTHFLVLLSIAGCFRFEVAGGALACPDNVCPNDLICENGIDSPFAGNDDGFCADVEGEACLTNLGCTPTVECPLDEDFLGLPCVAGVVCIDENTLGDVPTFQSGANPGICIARKELQSGDPCIPLDATAHCEAGTGCTVDEECDVRSGEDGDTCNTAITINGPEQVLLDVAGLDNNSASTICLAAAGVGLGAGGDLFIRYVVDGQGAATVDVTFDANNNGTLADTILYAGTACDPADLTKITGELDCVDDVDSVFNDFSSTLTLQDQVAGAEIFLVIDTFAFDREGLVDLTITED
jgi:hypothetical protein